MKEKRFEQLVTRTVMRYVADDGTEFETCKACVRYERQQKLRNVPSPEVTMLDVPYADYQIGLVELHSALEYEKFIDDMEDDTDYTIYIGCDEPESYPCRYAVWFDYADNSVYGFDEPTEVIADRLMNAAKKMQQWCADHPEIH